MGIHKHPHSHNSIFAIKIFVKYGFTLHVVITRPNLCNEVEDLVEDTTLILHDQSTSVTT
jgi:hypothetical protein